jgi:hypothetical protein
MMNLDKVVYVDLPGSREDKDKYHKEGYKVLPMSMKPIEDKPKRTRKTEQEAE